MTINLNALLHYAFYSAGFIAVFYIFLIFLRHILLYYILKTLRGIQSVVSKFTQNSNNDKSDREDELKRDQEEEIFKAEAQDIKNRINKKKNGDTIFIDAQKINGNTTQGYSDAFAGTSSRLEMGQENEKIVGIAKPIGKWTGLVLGKKMSQIASIMQHQNANFTRNNYWTSYIKARNEVERGRNQDRMQ